MRFKQTIYVFCIILLFTQCEKEDNRPCLCEDNLTVSGNSNFLGTIFIPNAFTPNYDLHNDYFMPRVSGVQEFEITIYSREGGEVFNTNDYSNQYLMDGGSEAWDGIGYDQGLYNYIITATDSIGNQKTITGSLSLVRGCQTSFPPLNYIFKDCAGVSACTFGDMIDPQMGFIYPTQEDIYNSNCWYNL
tara:strand:- start:480 stop:1046 length:567 start_codon:yes stop_codon:yes gene_type:complete